MTLKYEGDRVTRVEKHNGGNAVGYLFKMFFGNDPSQWVRFVILGVFLATVYFTAERFVNEFRREMVAESAAVRHSLTEYIAANEKWQALTEAERQRLIRKADARFRRLYQNNGWVYEPLAE